MGSDVESEDDENCSCDILISHQPPTKSPISTVHCGDVNVHFTPLTPEDVIHIWNGGMQWIQWDPTSIQRISVT